MTGGLKLRPWRAAVVRKDGVTGEEGHKVLREGEVEGLSQDAGRLDRNRCGLRQGWSRGRRSDLGSTLVRARGVCWGSDRRA